MGYDTCQRAKAHCKREHAPLNPNEILLASWKIILVDLIRELLISQGLNTIYIIVDCFNKQIYTIPTNTKLISEEMANIYWDNVFKLHSIPQKVISDWGPQFESWFIKDLYQLLGIEGNPSIAYHP